MTVPPMPGNGEGVGPPPDEEAFRLAEEELEGVPVVRLAGEIDLAAAPTVRDRLSALALHLAGRGPGGRGVVVVDLGEVTFIDSTGLSMLVAAHGRFAGSGMELRVASVPARVRQVLQLTGLDGLLSTYEDVPSALRGSRAERP